MQSVKLVVRQVGLPSPQMDVVSAEDFSLDVEYKYTSSGYKVMNSHYLGDVKNPNGDVIGYKFALILVKDSEPVEPKKKNAG